MRTLGIDYGRKKIGLAVSEEGLAEPYKVLRIKDFGDAIGKVLQVIKVLQADRVVVGVSENKMGEESENFSLSLSQSLKIPVETFDETLTSQDAQRILIESGVPQKKRREMEDAYAASIMLQNYLDSK